MVSLTRLIRLCIALTLLWIIHPADPLSESLLALVIRCDHAQLIALHSPVATQFRRSSRVHRVFLQHYKSLSIYITKVPLMIEVLTLTTPRHDFQICTYKSPYIWMRTAKSGNNMTMECFAYIICSQCCSSHRHNIGQRKPLSSHIIYKSVDRGITFPYPIRDCLNDLQALRKTYHGGKRNRHRHPQSISRCAR